MKSYIFVLTLLAWASPLAYGLDKISWEVVHPRSKKPLGKPTVEAAAVSTRILGNLVQTTVTFKVSSDFDPEGKGSEVYALIPHREGHTVTGLKWELPDGTIRNGMGSGKSIAFMAYSSVVSRMIDPALIEWHKDGELKLRLFPLFPKKPKQVTIQFTGPLERSGENWAYNLPIRFDKPKGGWKSDLDIDPASPAPVVQKPYLKGESHVGVFERAGEKFFAGILDLAESQPPIKDPRLITLIWDTSLSARERDQKKEFEILEKLLEGRDCRLEFRTFDVSLGAKQEFEIEKGDLSELKEHVSNLVYDGATSLSILKLSKIDSDLIIISSDCQNTLGSAIPTTGGPTVAVLDSISTNPSMPGQLIAEIGGGSYVKSSPGTPAELATQLLERHTTVSPASALVSGKKIDSIELVSLHGSNWIAGRFIGDGDELQIPTGKELPRLNIKLIPAGEEVFQFWAAIFAGRGINRSASPKLQARVASEAKIVTPLTSLIVLERKQDYQRFDIELPDDLRDEPRNPIPTIKLKESWDPRVSNWAVKEFRHFKSWWANPDSPPSDYARKWVDYEGRFEYNRLRELNFPPELPEQFAIEVAMIKTQLEEEKNEYQKALLAISKQIQESDDKVTTAELKEKRISIAQKLKKSVDDRLRVDWGTLRPNKDGKVGSGIVVNKEVWDKAAKYFDRPGSRSFYGPQGLLLPPPLENVGGGVVDPFAPSGGSFGGSFGGPSFSSPSFSPPSKEGGISDSVVIFKKSALDDFELGDLATLEGPTWESAYWEQRKKHGANISWLFSVSSELAKRGHFERAVRVLTSAIELSPNNLTLVRAIAWKLQQLGANAAAITLFERASGISDERFIKRDLALAYAEAGIHLKSALILQGLANDKLWDGYSAAAQEGKHQVTTYLIEMNRQLGLAAPERPKGIYAEHYKATPMDLRIVLDWDQGDVDLDLVVIDPNFEKLTGRSRPAPEGSMVWERGYAGPEELISKNAPAGEYEIRILNRSYEPIEEGDEGEEAPGATIAKLSIFTNWGRPNEKVETQLLIIPNDQPVTKPAKISFSK